MCKERAIVLDIDGVILDSEIILQEIYDLKLKGDDMWEYFQKNCNSSRVTSISSVYPLIASFGNSTHVILSTARNDKCRQETERKLKDENFPYEFLYMRKDGDYRSSAEVKRDHLKDIARKFDIIAFIDDDLSNCEMAKGEGIFALRKV